MINPKELRIGNIINSAGLAMVVLRIYEDRILYKEYEPRTILRHPSDIGANPIPLTNEIFKQAGFELFPWGFVKNDVLIRVHWNGQAAPKYWLEVGNGLRVDLLSVHQLQNLFHALTGEELEIKL